MKTSSYSHSGYQNLKTIVNILYYYVNLQHIAYEYARRGAILALVARRENRLQIVANKARELGSPEVIVIRANVSKDEECKHFIDETVKHFGRCKCIMCFCFGLICCRQTVLHSFIHTLKATKIMT